MPPDFDKISRRQMLAISFVSLMPPIIRLIPKSLTRVAGSASWLCCLAAFPVMLLLFWFMHAFLKNTQPGQGMGEVFLEVLGPVAGRAALGIFTAWFLFYAGFILRSGADRFVSTVYPDSQPAIFVVVMLILSLIAAGGRVTALARSASIFRVVLLLTFLVVFLFALPGADIAPLLAVTPADLGSVALASVSLIDACSIVVYFTFLEGHVNETRRSLRPLVGWIAFLLFLVLLLCLTTIGTFGPELLNNMNHPFFILIREIKLFSVIERIEAIVIALWMITDFVLVTLLFILAFHNAYLICYGRAYIAPRPVPGPGRRRGPLLKKAAGSSGCAQAGACSSPSPWPPPPSPCSPTRKKSSRPST